MFDSALLRRTPQIPFCSCGSTIMHTIGVRILGSPEPAHTPCQQGDHRGIALSHMQGVRFELAPDPQQTIAMRRHCGLSRVVENFCLEIVQKKWTQRQAEQTYGLTGDELTEVPWTAPELEKHWRAALADRYPWFTHDKMSSRVPKEACRVRAAGFANYLKSKKGVRRGPRIGFPSWRKHKHGSRFRYDAERARPLGTRAVRLPGIGEVATREDMSWLTRRLANGTARILGATVRERADRWWISFQLEVDRTDINARHAVTAGAPMCGIDLGPVASASGQSASRFPAQDHHTVDENQVGYRGGNPERQRYGQKSTARPRSRRRRVRRIRPSARIQSRLVRGCRVEGRPMVPVLEDVWGMQAGSPWPGTGRPHLDMPWLWRRPRS
ncbi:MAG: transposase [Nocardia sp.]|nr:transposase [Nocardia sp.]